MSRSLRCVSTVATFTAVVLVPAFAAASPEGGHGSIEWVTPVFNHTGNLGLVWAFINFAILAYLLEKILFSKLRARTRNKHDEIKSEIDKATAAREEAEGVLSEYRTKLDSLDKEIDELMAEAKKRAEEDRARIVADAKKEAEQIKASAKATAEREAAARKRQLEAEIVDRAVERAEALLRQKITPADQRGMVDQYVDRLTQVDIGGRPS